MNKIAGSEKITLIGAGPVGSLLSLFLARRGFDVEIFERRSDMRVETISAGRSINLALSTRGLYALSQVDLDSDILNEAIPMKGRMVHPLNGAVNLQPYGRNDSECIYSISRGGLNKILMSAAEATGKVKIHFNRKVKSVDVETLQLEIENVARGGKYQVQRIIGTDGSASELRRDLEESHAIKASSDVLSYGYKELTIPAGPGGSFLLEKNALHIWPRGTFMLIALPNLDGSFTATLFLAFTGNPSFEQLKTKDDVQNFFDKYFNDVGPLFPILTKDFFEHPMGQMVTVKGSPWFYKDKALLMGDAAHAIVPFFGQGMNCGFEDCTVFDSYLDTSSKAMHPFDWQSIFSQFSTERKPQADAIADLAVENFVEMRDKVGDRKFILEKNVEKILQQKFPRDYVSRYALVTFNRVPYTLALKAGIIENEILTELCHDLSRAEDVNLVNAEELIKNKLSPLLKSAGL